jgi:hypothetical protein
VKGNEKDRGKGEKKKREKGQMGKGGKSYLARTLGPLNPWPLRPLIFDSGYQF